MTYPNIKYSATILNSAGSEELDPEIASQFKILTCSATSCAARRRKVGLDEFATLAGLYERKEGACASEVEVEESSCLGCCKNAPCVAIEHEDFFGTVALEGMTPGEFNDNLFHNVLTDDDMNRVWACVENAIRLMAEEEE